MFFYTPPGTSHRWLERNYFRCRHQLYRRLSHQTFDSWLQYVAFSPKSSGDIRFVSPFLSRTFGSKMTRAAYDQKVARWVSKWILPMQAPLSIIFPIFQVDIFHWTVGIATIKTPDGPFSLQHYCPIRGDIPKAAVAIITRMMAVATGRRQTTPPKVHRVLGPEQFNMHDCGVFVAMFVRAFCFRTTFNCNSQATGEKFRRHMNEVITGRVWII